MYLIPARYKETSAADRDINIARGTDIPGVFPVRWVDAVSGGELHPLVEGFAPEHRLVQCRHQHGRYYPGSICEGDESGVVVVAGEKASDVREELDREFTGCLDLDRDQ